MQEDTTMPAFVDPEASGGPERARIVTLTMTAADWRNAADAIEAAVGEFETGRRDDMIESWKALVEIFRRSTR
jgi:hypothetical protein